MTRRALPLLSGLSLVFALAAASCGSDAEHPITQRRTIPQPRPEQTVAADTRQRLAPEPMRDPHAGLGVDPQSGLAHDPHAGTPPAQPAGIEWDLPAGWQEVTPTPLRTGNFVVPGKERLECYVTLLPGGGGGATANVNRWRQQIGQPEVSDADVAALPKVTLLGTEAPFVTGEAGGGIAMAATYAAPAGLGVSVKMLGRAADVSAEMDNFKALCASLRMKKPPEPAAPPPAAGPSDAAKPAGAAVDPAAIQWTIPEGWKQTGPRQMRLVTAVPDGVAGVECYVTVLRGGGSLEDNLNRWRSQAGLAPLSAEEIRALPRVDTLGGRKGVVVEIEGKESAIYGLVCELGTHTVFVKMTGPAEALRAERERFLAFCRSLS